MAWDTPPAEWGRKSGKTAAFKKALEEHPEAVVAPAEKTGPQGIHPRDLMRAAERDAALVSERNRIALAAERLRTAEYQRIELADHQMFGSGN